MLHLVAYVLLFLIGPSVGAIGSVLLMPLSIAIGRIISPFVAGQVVGVGQGFATAWFGKIFLVWFGITAGWLMVIILGIGFLFNDLKRIQTRVNTAIELGYLFGDISGLIMAWFIIL